MNYLFLDASDTKTLGQISTDKGLFTFEQETSRTLGAKISTFCDELLEQSDLQKNQVDLYAVGTGPGSLTGLRIAGSFLRSCAYISNKPIIGINLFTWAIQTLKEQNIKERVRLIMPTLIGKAFYLDIDSNIEAISELEIKPEFADLTTSKECSYKVLGIKYSAPEIDELQLSHTALDKLIKNLANTEGNNFSNMLKVLPMYVIPSQAERNFRGKKC